MIPEAAVEAASRALDFHLPDKAHESGCALRCGYVGDDLAEHLAGHMLEAAAPHMLAEAWDEGSIAGWVESGLPHSWHAENSLRNSNPYRSAK